MSEQSPHFDADDDLDGGTAQAVAAEAADEAEQSADDAAEVTAVEADGTADDESGEADEAVAEAPAADDVDEDGDVVVDPVAEFKAQLRRAPGDWYVIHSYAGYENRVKANLENRISSLNMEDYIFQCEVPMEEVTEIKNGQRKQVNRKVLPGYILVRMDLTDDSWSTVRNTPGVTGFVGATSRPTALSLDDVVKFLLPQGAAKKAGKAASSTAAAAGGEATLERPASRSWNRNGIGADIVRS